MWLPPPAATARDGPSAPLTVRGVFPAVPVATLTLAWFAHRIPSDEHGFAWFECPPTLPTTPARLPGVPL